MSLCLINVSVIKEITGTLADIPSEDIMPFNDIPSKDDIVQFWSTEGLVIITNARELEEFKKYIAWEVYDFNDYPRQIKKISNSSDEILSNRLKINFNLHSLVISIGAKIKNLFFSDIHSVYLTEFDSRFNCASNSYFGYQIEAISKTNRIKLLNEKPECINEMRVLNFNSFPLKKNSKGQLDLDEEKEKNIKDYLCYLQSQNTINNINLELLYDMMNTSNLRSQRQIKDELDRINMDNISQQLSSLKKDEKTNILLELQLELQKSFETYSENSTN